MEMIKMKNLMQFGKDPYYNDMEKDNFEKTMESYGFDSDFVNSHQDFDTSLEVFENQIPGKPENQMAIMGQESDLKFKAQIPLPQLPMIMGQEKLTDQTFQVASVEHNNLVKYYQGFQNQYSGQRFHRDTAEEIKAKQLALENSIRLYRQSLTLMESGIKTGNRQQYAQGVDKYRNIARPTAQKAVAMKIELRPYSLPLPFLTKKVNF